MTNLNPGLAKGYALDFGSPVRYVAEALREGPRTLEDLAKAYSHDAAELSRVWDQELRKPRERRSVKEAQEERAAQAKQWLMQRAIEALGSQVRSDGDRYVLAVDFDDLRVGGLPLPGSSTYAEASSREASRPRASKGARGSRRPKSERSSAGRPDERAVERVEDGALVPSRENEPEQESEVRQWLRAQRYTPARLAKALDMERAALQPLIDGSQQPSRMVRLALWALEHGAQTPA